MGIKIRRPLVTAFVTTQLLLAGIWVTSSPKMAWISTKGIALASSSIVVDNSTDVGAFANLAIVDGYPAIAYFDRFNLRLKYVRANDVHGATWGPPAVADSTQYSGLYVSLAVVDGNPAIAYYNSSSKSLNYVRANDAFGQTWAAPVTVDKNGNVGLYASLAIVNGNPAIAYQDESDANHSQMKFVRATDANGAAWGTPVIVDNSGNPGWGLSMKAVNGFPAIAYFNIGGTPGLKYIVASNAIGSAWNSPVSVDHPIPGTLPSMTIVNGKPAIAYGDTSSSSNGHLKYARALDDLGASWGTPVNVDTSGNAGYFPWLSVINGLPAVAYTDNTTHGLKFVQAVDPSGTTWWQPVIVDSGQFDVYPSLADVNSAPGIAYEDYSGTGSLRFILPTIPPHHEMFIPVLRQ